MRLFLKYNKLRLLSLSLGVVLLSSSALAAAQASSVPLEVQALSKALGKDVSKSVCLSKDTARRQRQTTTRLPAQASLQAMTGDPASATGAVADSTAKLKMDHSHIPIMVPTDVPVPALSLVLTPDVMSGYNLTLKTVNYDLTPPPQTAVSMEDLMGIRRGPETGFVEGHAHLYINGEKIQRIYGGAVHLPQSLFKTGINQINVTLNNHAHMYWTNGTKKILSTVFINTETAQLITYQFDSFPVGAKTKP